MKGLSTIAEMLLFKKDAQFISASHVAARFNIEIPEGHWAYFLGFDFTPNDLANATVPVNLSKVYSIIASNREKTLTYVHKDLIVGEPSDFDNMGFKSDYPLYLRSRSALGFTITQTLDIPDPANFRVGDFDFWKYPPFKHTWSPEVLVTGDEFVRYQFDPTDAGPQYYYQPLGNEFTQEFLGLAPTGRTELPYFVLAPNARNRLAAPNPNDPQIAWPQFPAVNVYYILVRGDWPNNWKEFTNELLNE